MTKIADVTKYLENFAPKQYQESYDNSGLIVGNPNTEVTGILLSLDATETIVEEAIAQKCNLIVAHHPIVFRGLKKLNGNNYVERTVIKAIKNDIAIYAIHTNLDNVKGGVNYKIAEKLALEKVQILAPKSQILQKLVVFVPKENIQQVLFALNEAGAGQIGNYQNCSFRTEGIGTFQPNEDAHPHIGRAGGELEEVKEERLEVIFPTVLQHKIMQALKKVHPYEEVAYYLHHLENTNQEVGAGAIGNLAEKMPAKEFLVYLKEKMNLKLIKHTNLLDKKIKKVAVCGGTGSFLLSQAKRQGADIFITADYKYHEFFDAEKQIIIADIGHYESEVFTKELLKEILLPKFETVKIELCKSNTNPVEYYF